MATPPPLTPGGDGTNPNENRKSTMAQLYADDPNNPMKVRFDRDHLEYLPGETINGIVFLELNKIVNIKKISINVLGTGRTSWAVAVENKKKQLDTAHASTESYIDVEFTVTDKAETLPPGKKEFPFSYVLPPPPLPCTYIDAYGSITYIMKVTAITDQPEKLECLGAFLINGIYDLNEDWMLNQRAELCDHRSVGCGCIKSGKIELSVKLHHRGFLLGETISWTADIKNNSSSNVKQVSARLMQHALFHATGNIKLDAKAMVSVNAGTVKKKGQETWEGSLKVPPTLPTTTSEDGSKLIIINYGLEFELEVDGCTKNLKAEIPIAIGTIGLNERNSKEDITFQFGRDKTLDKIPVKPASKTGSKAENPGVEESKE